MSLIDSKASFAARAVELGLEALLPKMQELGFTTYASFAFAANYTPGQVGDSAFKAGVIVPLLGTAHVELQPVLRRLFFESFTLMSADLKAKLEATDADKPTTMTVAEREARRDATIPKTSGLMTDGVHDPAHATIDLAAAMMKNDIVTYLPLERCPSREDERKGMKIDPKLKSKNKDVDASLATDLDLQNASIRRGLAADMGGLFKYSNHEKLMVKMMTAKTSPPPPGYRQVTMQQLRVADEKFWDILAELTRKGIKRVMPEGTVLDSVFDRALEDIRFAMLLVPLPLAAGRNRSRTPRSRRERGGKGKDKGDKGPKAKGKGKGKDKGHNSSPPVPRELLPEGVSVTGDQEAICFSYNTRRGCSEAQPGGYCWKGKHVCCFKGCFRSHTFQAHKQALREEDLDGEPLA